MNDIPPRIPPAYCHLLDEVPLRLPFWQYYDLYLETPYSFLLDSEQSERLGQYSFIGGEPTLVYRAKRKKVGSGQGEVSRVQGSGFSRTTLKVVLQNVQESACSSGLQPKADSLQSFTMADIEVIELVDSTCQRLETPKITRLIDQPFDVLRQLLDAHRVDYQKYADHPVPFLAGAIGYIGYEAGHFIEELPDSGADDLALPDIYLMFVSTVLAHCHRTGRTYLSIVGRGEDEIAARKQAEILRDKMLDRMAGLKAVATVCDSDLQSVPDALKIRSTDIHCHSDQSEYCRKIEYIKEHISAGDVYQVCLTRRMDAPLVGGAAWDLYKELRRINPAPFACFLNFPEARVVSSSPERFLSLCPDRIAESRPIKGTRPRGATPEEDQRLREELSASAKDQAENLMIVDLVRNDLGRVCDFGSIEVPEFMLIEDYATVFQMVSTIRGRLAEGRDALDLICACFPGGSMTGAPKIEAMKIIDRLEPFNRGIYSGAIGYLDFAGAMDLSIVIRTIVVKNDRCYFHTGGGIVADSNPQSEFQETEDKARALVAALMQLK